MINRRGLLQAALGCATAPSLVGCATTNKKEDAQFIGHYLNLLSQTMKTSDGKRDEVVIAMTYEYYRRNSGNKDIQGSIESILKDNEVTLQQAEDVWAESKAKVQAIMDQGDEAVYQTLIKMVQDRSKTVIYCPHPHPEGRKKGLNFPIAKVDVPKLGIQAPNPTETQVCARITELYIQQHGPIPGSR